MRQAQILRIVVASPNDVMDERNILEEVAAELNRGIAKDRSLHIEISRWETDAFPGFHVDGPQGIIDFALNIEDCDLLIGIFWKRFGTPTKDAKSGTEHEFRKAYEAWKRNGHPQIMFYFNEQNYSLKTKEQWEQLGQVIDFKTAFPEEGLFRSYTDKFEFEKLVRLNLTKFVLNIPVPDGALSGSSQKSFNHHPSSAIITSTNSSLSIDKQISLWLEVKASKKHRTREQYERHITQFRDVLLKYGFDLNSEDEKVISSLVEQWANSSKKEKKVADLTFNQRLSSVRSFYQFACEHHCMRSNPIERVKRRKEKRREPNYVGNILDLDTIAETITSGLKSIDRKTLLGKRDYALLSILFTTLHRVSEVKNLKCGDISINGNNATVTWRDSRKDRGCHLNSHSLLSFHVH